MNLIEFAYQNVGARSGTTSGCDACYRYGDMVRHVCNTLDASVVSRYTLLDEGIKRNDINLYQDSTCLHRPM